MPFCGECGKNYPDGLKFCPHCGSPNALAVMAVNPGNAEKIAGIGAESSGDTSGTGDFHTVKRRGSGPYGAVRLEALPEGFVIDSRYEIINKLGQGGFGAVYLAHDRQMEIDKALKIIPESVASDREAMSDLQAEARTMVSLNNEYIVRVYDFHSTGDIKYIDMEYIPGKPLNEVKLERKGKKLGEKEVKALGVKIARGMAYAHRNKVIHKDIKPQNIMVTDEGGVKIMDFGISEAVRTSMSRVANSSSSGTLVYMSPEQVKGQDVGRESDIYSFGAMLYELLCGHPPFYKGAIEYQIFNERPTDLSGVSPEMNVMIQRCLEKDYRERYRSFEEVEAVLLKKREPMGSGEVDGEGSDVNKAPPDTIKKSDSGKGEGWASDSAKEVQTETIIGDNPLLRSQKRRKSKVLLIISIAIVIASAVSVVYSFSRQIKQEMVLVEGGTFQMGSASGGENDTSPAHQVTVSDFYMSRYEVTQGLYREVMGSKSSKKKSGIGDNYPVNKVSWYDAVTFCNRLSDRDWFQPVYTIDGDVVTCNWGANGYRLPTEAEWEYAACGGKKSGGYTYAGSDSAVYVAWYDDTSEGMTHPVGQKRANELGLFDMSGNVWEWCWDWYGNYRSGSQQDPRGLAVGSYRVIRGGSWYGDVGYCRVAIRYDRSPDYSSGNLGFRVVRRP